MDKKNSKPALRIGKIPYSCLAAPVIVTLIVLSVYAIKGVYPFGNASVAYYDMTQQYIPLYHHTYDVLHGDKAAFYDWLSGAGESMVGLFGTYILSPVNLFFLFVRRDMILESMSFFLLLKLVLTAAAMTFYLRKTYKKLPAVYMVIFTLLYTLGGYVLQYYVNLFFLDIVMLFPLLMYGKNRLYRKKGMAFYVAMLAFCVCTSIYLSFMICIYLILDAFVYACIMKRYGERGRFIGELAVGTAFAMGLAAFCLLPEAYNLIGTARADMSSDVSYLKILRTIMCEMPDQKYFMLYGLELPLVLAGGYLLSGKRKLQFSKVAYYFCIIGLLALPVIFEGVDMMWHMGFYQSFPMRFAYILEFVVIDFAAYCVNRYHQRLVAVFTSPVVKRIFLYLGIASCFFTVVILYVFHKGFLKEGIHVNDGNYKFLGITFFWLFLSYILCSLIADIKVRNALFFFLALAQTGIGAYGLLAPADTKTSEPTTQVIFDAKEMRETFSLDNDNLSRIKCRDATIGVNYPLMLGYPAISNWTGVLQRPVKETLGLLGHTQNNVRLADTGGTVFSDALLNCKKTVASTPQEERLYQLEDTSDSFYLYNNIFTLPFGMRVSKEFCTDFSGDGPFEKQNNLYRNLTGKEDDLFTVYTMKELGAAEYEQVYGMEVPADEEIALYAYMPYNPAGGYIFKINGEEVILGDWGNDKNIYYQTYYNNGVVLLGVFEENIRLEVCSLSGDEPELTLGAMSLGKMRKLSEQYEDYPVSAKAEGRSLTLETEGEAGKYVFLPVTYAEGFRARNNGKETEVLPAVNGAFMAVPLQDGKNTIKLSYFPPYMKEGILISCLTLLAVILALVFRVRAVRILYNRYVQGICSILFILLALALLVAVYALPVAGGVVSYYFDMYAA